MRSRTIVTEPASLILQPGYGLEKVGAQVKGQDKLAFEKGAPSLHEFLGIISYVSEPGQRPHAKVLTDCEAPL